MDRVSIRGRPRTLRRSLSTSSAVPAPPLDARSPHLRLGRLQRAEARASATRDLGRARPRSRDIRRLPLMPPRKLAPVVLEFEQPYPSMDVRGTPYQLHVPAVAQDGLALMCRINCWNGAATFTRDNVHITDDAGIKDFLGAARVALPEELRTEKQRRVWREACEAIAANLPDAMRAEQAKQSARQTPSQSQATRLVTMAQDAELFHAPEVMRTPPSVSPAIARPARSTRAVSVTGSHAATTWPPAVRPALAGAAGCAVDAGRASVVRGR